jgi:pimeloyl-ACP methyl ester carboxylesterase
MENSHSIEKKVSWVENKKIEFWHVYPKNVENKKDLPKIVFMHGWGLSPQSYLGLIQNISANKFYVIAPSLPGFGNSDPLTFSLNDTYKETTSHLYEALREADLLAEETFFVGHSFGAGLSVNLVEFNPSITKNIVLLCPIGGSPGNPVSWMKLLAGLRHEWGNSSFDRARDALPSFFKNPFYLASSGIAAKNTSLFDSLNTVTGIHGIPVNIIAANNDGVVPLGTLKNIENVNITMVEGNHGWPLSYPKECADFVHASLLGENIASQ